MSDPNWYRQNEKTIAMVNEHGEVMHKLFNEIAMIGLKVDDFMIQLDQAFASFETRKKPDNYRAAFPKFDAKKLNRMPSFGSAGIVLGSAAQ